MTCRKLAIRKTANHVQRAHLSMRMRSACTHHTSSILKNSNTSILFAPDLLVSGPNKRSLTQVRLGPTAHDLSDVRDRHECQGKIMPRRVSKDLARAKRRF
jgi:hypothetical protein